MIATLIICVVCVINMWFRFIPVTLIFVAFYNLFVALLFTFHSLLQCLHYSTIDEAMYSFLCNWFLAHWLCINQQICTNEFLRIFIWTALTTRCKQQKQIRQETQNKKMTVRQVPSEEKMRYDDQTILLTNDLISDYDV